LAMPRQDSITNRTTFGLTGIMTSSNLTSPSRFKRVQYQTAITTVGVSGYE